MEEEITFLPLQGNEKLVDKYFYHLFSEGSGQAMEALKSYCKLEGFVVDDLRACEFAAEYTEEEGFYFGENLVGICHMRPWLKEVKMVVLDYEEFYDIAEREYMIYAEKHKHCKEEIIELLKQLKSVLLSA